jgi:enolase
MADVSKYDIEGPKILFDTAMLADWLAKICVDHPLVTYIEDPFSINDIAGYQKLIEICKEKAPHVKIAVKAWFGSDLDLIKEHTALIQEASDDEEEEDEEAVSEE